MSGVADYEPDDPQAGAVEQGTGEDEMAPGQELAEDGWGDEDIPEPNEPA